MNRPAQQDGNLLGVNVEIQLYCANDVNDRLGIPNPTLPRIECRLVKRIFSFTWNYLAELKEPLFLDREGVHDAARKKIMARYVKIVPIYTYKDMKQDNIYLRVQSDGEVNVIVSYVEDMLDVPNELLIGEVCDPYFSKMPVISSGTLVLKK